MFERFSDAARDSVAQAQAEAQRLNHNYLGTEHLLLGLLAVEDSTACEVLNEMGMTLDIARDALVEISPKGFGAEDVVQNLPFTPRAKGVLEGALREALSLGNNHIGTEHILMSLARHGDGLAPHILESVGLDIEMIGAAVIKNLAEGASDEPDQASKESSKGRSKASRGKKRLKVLEKFSRNLTAMAAEGELDPVIGRETESERMLQILARRTKSNPVLIGEPGTGKTAAVEGLAQRLANGSMIPAHLKSKQIHTLDMALMVAGTRYRGEFEARLRDLVKEIEEHGDVILFIDEIHTLVGAGSAEGSLDAANILKPALARGAFQVIGATTIEEYRKHLEKDKALTRRFQPVNIDPPTVQDAQLILRGLRDRYEQHHQLQISDQALDAACELSDRYISDRFLPDKAIDLIDEAAARMRMQARKAQDDPELGEKIQEVRQNLDKAVSEERFEDAAELREQEKKLYAQRDEARKSAEDRQQQELVVEREHIAEVVAMWTGVPAGDVSEDERQALLDLEDNLTEYVLGQPDAVSTVARALRRNRAGFRDKTRPIGSFLFLGPTGVGKTELARTLARQLFGSEDSMIRLDMSEYMERHAVSRLVGSPPGYIGHGEGGQLTEPVRRRPYSVLLLDEIEKAHPDVSNMLLQILEDGRLTDSQGRTVNFTNTIIIMTSNLGAREITRDKKFGFASDESNGMDTKEINSAVGTELKRAFRPELLNRIDETIVFKRLGSEQLLGIVDLLLTHLRDAISERGATLIVTDAAKQQLAEIGYDPSLGARPLRRAIQQQLEDRLADLLLAKEIVEGAEIVVDYADGEFQAEARTPELAPA